MTDDTSDGRMRLTIVGGFLGSGKTTWLRHQLYEGVYDNAHVLVNEAAGTPVDHALLDRSARLSVLAGGCACCEGAELFRETLLEICDSRSRSAPGERIDRIVLETSGLADPGAISALILAHPVLVRHIVIREVIVIVDALHGLASLRTQPLARAQVRSADRLVLTKTDLAIPADLGHLRHTLARLAPGADQQGATFGSPADLPDLPATDNEALPDLSGAEPPITTRQLDLGDAPDWTALTLWLSALLHARGDSIVRVKGVVATPAGRLLIQAVRKTVQSPERLPAKAEGEAADNVIVLIGSGLAEADIERSFRSFA